MIFAVRRQEDKMSKIASKVIFLNGASSSGKTTIAKALQKVLSPPYLHISVDDFLHQLPAAAFSSPLWKERLPSLIAGFEASCAAIARESNNVIMDHLVVPPTSAALCAATMDGIDVIFVGIRCSLETLEDREKKRGNRRAGLARSQHEGVHAHGGYDVEVDTSLMPLDECVARISGYVDTGQQPSAFRRIRAQVSTGSLRKRR